jgi:single-strand DNA-binding protein
MNTTITFAGNLAGAPQVEHTPDGKQVATFRVLVNRKSRTETGDWVDGEPTGHNVRVYGTAATHARESLHRGDRAVVHGILKSYAWLDTDGEKHTRVVVDVSDSYGEIGLSLRWHTAHLRHRPEPAAALAAGER